MRRFPLLILVLFFFSGGAALVYEVVWIRLLSLTLSVTVYALTTVLCAFMAGLASGAAIAAALADRIRRPLLAFGLVELGIAACGLVVPAILYRLPHAYVWLHGVLGGEGLAFVVSRFLLAFVVLLVPATLMGMTLPFLSRALIGRPDMVGRGAGALYAANTLGAVIGVIAAGFFLIPQLGLSATSIAAATANVSIGVLALLAAGQVIVPVTPRSAGVGARPLPTKALLASLAFGVSGFTAMGYEVLWTRSLEHYTHNSTYAYSAMLAMFLAGLGIGSAAAARIADRVRSPLAALGAVQLGIGVTVVAALLVYMQFETALPAVASALGGLSSWPRVVGMIFGEAAVTLTATTLLFGATFPLVARAAVDSLETVGNRIGLAYVANTLGSILGALLVGFVVLPWLGIRGAFVALIVTNLLLGAALVFHAAPGRPGRLGAAGGLVAVALTFVLVPPDFLEAQFRERFGELLFYKEEVTDIVMVTQDDAGERMIRYGDGRGTAGTWTVVEDRVYAHIPMLLHGSARNVLQIGFGVGNTLSSVSRYPIEQATCVELSPGVLEAARFFESTNRKVMEQSDVDVVINDGRNFLLASRDRYDVIRLDPPELHTAGVVNLYTQEFYESAREHLAPGGIFSIWVNNVMTPVEGLRMIVRTIQSVFPHVSVWHGPAAYSWVINGSLQSHAPDLAALQRQFELPAVRADLATIEIEDPFQFLRLFVFAGEQLEPFIRDVPIVTDDHTRLDFDSPRSVDSFFGIANINTGNYLVRLIEPDGKGDLARKLFFRKVRELASYKRSVMPHLTGVRAAGYEPDAVRRRIEGAPAPPER